MSVINTNYLALVSQNNLTKSQNSLGTAIERLSSGLRINSAKDDAAGQAIANRFTANIKGLTQAARNANDGVSIAQTTEGALNEINNNLQRIRELSVQAANGSNSAEDKASIQNEIKERLDEIDRVSRETQFNGKYVLGGDAKTMSVQVGAHDNQRIDINLSRIDKTTLKLGNLDVRNDNFDTNKLKDLTPQTLSTEDLINPVAKTVASEATFEVNDLTFSDPNAPTLSFSIYTDDTTSGEFFAFDGTNYYTATFNATTNTFEFDSTVDLGTTVPTTLGEKLDDGEHIDIGNGNTIDFADTEIDNGDVAAPQAKLYVDSAGALFASYDNGTTLYSAGISAEGVVSFDSSGAGDAATGVVSGVLSGQVVTVDGADVDTASHATDFDAEPTLHEVTDAPGQYVLKGEIDGETVYFKATLDTASGTVTKGAQIAQLDTSSIGEDAKVYKLEDGSYVAVGEENGATAYYSVEVDEDGGVTLGAKLNADPLASIDAALQDVDDLRSHLGAIQNRFQSTIANLNNTVNNLSAARSRIEDADYAVEVSNMTRAQILQQAGTSVLAQANQVPQGVLSLLR